MNSNFLNLRSFFKFLSKNKAYTAIDIFGLSVSLMFVIIIGLYTVQELSIDNFQKNKDRIYVVSSEAMLHFPYGIGERLQDNYPEIEDINTTTSCLLFTGSPKMPVIVNDETIEAITLFSNENFFRFFSFPLSYGSPTSVLQAQNSVVISESFARKAFPGKDPIGQVIKLADTVLVTVDGIMKDIKHSTITYCDILGRIEYVKNLRSDIDGKTFNNAGNSTVFLLAHENANLQSKAADMPVFFKDFFWPYKNGHWSEVKLTPLKDVYYSLDFSYYLFNKGNKIFVLILMSVGLLILLFAIINYINLTVAQTGFRAKEMATRRLLGSERKDLFFRLIMEATLLSFISFAIGVLLAFAVLPYAESLLNTKFYIADAISPVTIIVSVLLILVLGFLSGIIPAVVISNAKPIDVVRGGFRQKTKMVFSKFFITFQSVITIILIAVSLIMTAQVHHLINAPLGYNTTNIIDISVHNLSDRNNKVELLTKELEQLTSVKRVALTQGTPSTGGNNHTVTYESGKVISFQQIVCDSTCFSMLGFEVLRDNQLELGKGIFLTEQALKELELDENAESFEFYKRQEPVAGIVKDFQLFNIMLGAYPTIISLLKNDWAWNMLVEVQGDPHTAYNEVKNVYERVIKLEFPGKFMDQQIEESFATQRRTSQIMVLFTCIAILISLLGLLAMSTYFIQQRSREIGVRKVFGSTNAELLFRLVKTFMSYVGIAFIIAAPIAWYLMKNWLTDYSYRISLSPLYFVLAGLFCLIVSFITVFWQSYIAANSNPVNSIKND